MPTDVVRGRVAGGRIEFERGQSEREKRAALHLCGFEVLDDTGAVVCGACGSPAVWLSAAKAGEATAVGCSNEACPRKQPPAGEKAGG